MLPTEEQIPLLLETMQQFNAACDWMSGIAFQRKAYKRIPLHTLCYYEAREKFSLASEFAILAISKVCASYSSDKSTRHVFGPYSATYFDSRILRLQGVTSVSMRLLDSRHTIRLDCGSYQRRHLASKPDIGQVELLYDGGQFTLALSIRKADPPPIQTKGTLGVDLGIAEIATDSLGNQYSGERVKSCRRRYRQLRKTLESHGKKSAMRRLRAIRHKVTRFCHHVNHCVSKLLVARALTTGKAIALESLDGILERDHSWAREARWALNCWAFAHLRRCITYKAQDVGLPVVLVDPRNTSRTCSSCGHCDKGNRRSQSKFVCQKCGFEVNADINAAINIEARANVISPKDVRLQLAL